MEMSNAARARQIVANYRSSSYVPQNYRFYDIDGMVNRIARALNEAEKRGKLPPPGDAP